MKKDKNTKQIEKTQISGNVVKKAILPTFCFARYRQWPLMKPFMQNKLLLPNM